MQRTSKLHNSEPGVSAQLTGTANLSWSMSDADKEVHQVTHPATNAHNLFHHLHQLDAPFYFHFLPNCFTYFELVLKIKYEVSQGFEDMCFKRKFLKKVSFCIYFCSYLNLLLTLATIHSDGQLINCCIKMWISLCLFKRVFSRIPQTSGTNYLDIEAMI